MEREYLVYCRERKGFLPFKRIILWRNSPLLGRRGFCCISNLHPNRGFPYVAIEDGNEIPFDKLGMKCYDMNNIETVIKYQKGGNQIGKENAGEWTDRRRFGMGNTGSRTR